MLIFPYSVLPLYEGAVGVPKVLSLFNAKNTY